MHYLFITSYIIRAIGCVLYTIAGVGMTVAMVAMVVNVATIFYLLHSKRDE